MNKLLVSLGVITAIAVPVSIATVVLVQQNHSKVHETQNGFSGKFSSLAKQREFEAITTEVKPGQFKDEKNLTSVYLPNVKTVGAKAFADSPLFFYSCHKGATIASDAFPTKLAKCPNTFKGTFKASKNHPVEWIKWKFLTINDRAMEDYFQDQNGLTEVNLPTVAYIGDNAFKNCPLTSLEIPNVISIGARAFVSSKLTKLNLPKVKSIGKYAFFNSPLVSDKNHPFILPLVETVGEGAFGQAPGLKDVEMPLSKTLGVRAFERSVILALVLGPDSTVGKDCFADAKTQSAR